MTVSQRSNASTTCIDGIFGETSPSTANHRQWYPVHLLTKRLFNRYIADYVYALPTIAFFMCSLGIFITANFISSQILGYRRFRGPRLWQKLIAVIRYLSYRGFHVKALRWNSAPLGVLLLGAAGTIYFLCKLQTTMYYQRAVS